jgi:Fe2+ or Zn2+ uptake regulation protein
MYGAVTRQTLYRSAWNILLGHIKGLLIDIALFAKLRIVYNMHLPRLHLREWGTRNIRAFIENLQLDLNRYLMLSDYNLDGYHGESVLVKRARCPPDCYKEDSPNRIEASVPLSSLNIIIPDSTYLESLLRRVIKPLHLAVDNLKTKLAGLALKIHSFVCKQGLSHTSQLLKTNSQVSRSTVYRVINQLLSTNMIRRVEHGLYAPFAEEEEENDEHKQLSREKVLNRHHAPGERTHYDDTSGDLATVYSELDVLLLEATTLQSS